MAGLSFQGVITPEEDHQRLCTATLTRKPRVLRENLLHRRGLPVERRIIIDRA
jgi:hypothetical protein